MDPMKQSRLEGRARQGPAERFNVGESHLKTSKQKKAVKRCQFKDKC